MAIPAGVQKIVFFGDLAGGEIWESGFWLNGGLPSSDSAAALQAELIYNVFLSESDPPVFPELASAFWNSSTNVKGARCYAYPDGGPNATYAGEYLAPSPTAGSKTQYLPNQVAMVVTLRTAQSGRSYRGRMYLPCSAGALQTSGSGVGQLTQAPLQALCDDITAAFRDIASSSAGEPCVVSSARSAATPITTVTMDTRLDIQRRRANKQTPTGTASSSV